MFWGEEGLVSTGATGGGAPLCQFRVLDGEVHILDLGGVGQTRVNGEPLPWGEARKLELNDSVEVAGHALILTNRSVFGPGSTRERTRVAPAADETSPGVDEVTQIMSAARTMPRDSAVREAMDAVSDVGTPIARLEEGGAESSQMLDVGSFYQALWSKANSAVLTADSAWAEARAEPTPHPGAPRADSGLRLVSSVSLPGREPWDLEEPRTFFRLLAVVSILMLLVAALVLWKRAH